MPITPSFAILYGGDSSVGAGGISPPALESTPGQVAALASLTTDPITLPLAGRVRVDDNVLPMLVKGWSIKAGAKTASNYVLRTQKPPDLTLEQYRFVDSNGDATANPNVKFGQSIPNQGSTPHPLAYFTDHQAVEIMLPPDAKGNDVTILFDPSYGTVSIGKDALDDDARLLTWQNQSLDFVGGYGTTPANPTIAVYLLQPITVASGLLIKRL